MNAKNNPKLIRAKRLLLNYFKVCWPDRKGPDMDCRSEIEEIVDLIFEAARECSGEAGNKREDD